MQCRCNQSHQGWHSTFYQTKCLEYQFSVMKFYNSFLVDTFNTLIYYWINCKTKILHVIRIETKQNWTIENSSRRSWFLRQTNFLHLLIIIIDFYLFTIMHLKLVPIKSPSLIISWRNRFNNSLSGFNQVPVVEQPGPGRGSEQLRWPIVGPQYDSCPRWRPQLSAGLSAVHFPAEIHGGWG